MKNPNDLRVGYNVEQVGIVQLNSPMYSWRYWEIITEAAAWTCVLQISGSTAEWVTPQEEATFMYFLSYVNTRSRTTGKRSSISH